MFGNRMGEITAIPVAVYTVAYSNASQALCLKLHRLIVASALGFAHPELR
jgi:hypothetical protein